MFPPLPVFTGSRKALGFIPTDGPNVGVVLVRVDQSLGANEAAVEYVTWNVHWVVDRFTEGEWVTTSGHYFKADYAAARADFLARAA